MDGQLSLLQITRK